MPFPAHIQRETLLQTAAELIEANGLDQLTLGTLAAQLGIATPSLYHHFKNKTALLQAVNGLTAHDLTQAMQEAAQPTYTPKAQVTAMFHAYRNFAHRYPNRYSLLYATMAPELRISPEQAEPLALPLQRVLALWLGEEKALEALRGGWALVHGFIMLELAGQFQRGGDLNTAFEIAIQTYIAGLTAR
ncbi:MAG: TetR/AcrR family transcriptional regulator [Phototrophicaceae bacterium]|jgi:AcrR family transcriptional regulator